MRREAGQATEGATRTEIPIAGYLCELCKRFRANKPRAFGIRFIDGDGSWACAMCYDTYLALLDGKEVLDGRA